VASAQRHLGEALGARRLRSPLDRVFGLEEASAAHERMRSNAHLGKIVLRIGS
jgi:NADPH2:quinone reductase